MIKRIFYSQTKNITVGAFILAISAFTSRLLGLIRDRLLASQFGASQELDIYFAAFRIPDFIYGVLVAGGISAAFLPLFAECFNHSQDKDVHHCENPIWPEKAIYFANNILNSLFVFLILICGIFAIFTPAIIKFVIPGFSPEAKAMAVTLTRVLFLSPILFGLSSVLSGILHYFNRFLVYSLAPIFYNLGIIFGILFLAPIFGILGVAYGVILGAFFHFLIQFPAVLISGYKYRPILNLRSQRLKRLLKLALPRIIGSASYQINLIVITAIASTLAVGSIVVFNFSNNLHYFPIGLIGVSFAVSSFPVFSRTWAMGQRKVFLEKLLSSLRQVIFLIVPVAFLIFLLRAQLVRIVLGAGKFGWTETRLTAACLGLFSLGIIAESIVPILSKGFFAFQETKIPVIISVFSIVLNIVFSFLFVGLLSFPGPLKNFAVFFLRLKNINDIRITALPLALSLSAFIQVILLLYFLKKRIKEFNIKNLAYFFLKVLIVVLGMSLFAFVIRQISSEFVNMRTFLGVFLQTIFTGGGGLAVYFLIAHFLNFPELKAIKLAFLEQLKK